MDILERNMVPFPYKTAKALDGTHYRNLPQDVWTELVKGQCNGRNRLTGMRPGLSIISQEPDTSSYRLLCLMS